MHGWKSHPTIWNRLISRLREESIPYWNFSHAEMKNAKPEAIAAALQDFIAMMRENTGYTGPIDIVCHSMGTCIARYMLEVIDADTRIIRIRQLIGIGPPNNGSSLAELFNHPEFGPQIISQLAGVFVPHGYDPADDIIVQEFRPGSRTITTLQAAETRHDISYRFILAANHAATPDFFPGFDGKTWEFSPDEGWQMTYFGDGIVPHTDSYLPGAGLDILPADSARLSRNPQQYSHIGLPKNSEVINRIVEYLCDASTQPGIVCPDLFLRPNQPHFLERRE